MQSERENFLRVLKLRVAATTFKRKQWQIQSFHIYLLTHTLHYSQVKKETIEQYLLSQHCNIRSKQQLIAVIREFYEYVKLPDPTNTITFKKNISKRLPDVPSQPLIQSIIDTFDAQNAHFALRNKALIELAYGSGLRRSELVNLDIDDIDRENKTVYVQGKGGCTRIVPITEYALTSIREYIATRGVHRGPLFLSCYKRRLAVNSVNWILKKAGIHPHQLRHACATHMLKNGCSIRVIQELLGHKDLKTTQIYTHINKEQLKEVINRTHPRRE